MKVNYSNRYGDNITFEKTEDNKVIMTGYDSHCMRYVMHGDTKMVDPSGGPYLSIGTNLKYYFDVKEDMIISDIMFNKGSITFILNENNKTKDQNSLNEG
jgi:ribosomal protein L33